MELHVLSPLNNSRIIDYKALGNVNTKLIGRVTDSREREKLKGLFANATNPKKCLDSLSIAKPGEFMLHLSRKRAEHQFLSKFAGCIENMVERVTDADIRK